MNELIVKDSIEVAAPARAVWRTLVDPEQTRRYMFGCAAVTDWKIGSPLEWTATVDGKPIVYVKGVVEAVEPERFLQYTTFGVGMGLPETPNNILRVTVRLTPAGDKTRVEITQGDFAGADNAQPRFEETKEGWRAVLPRIREIAESLI